MAYTRATTIDVNPGGDSGKQGFIDLDADMTNIFADLNTHEALTATHGATGAIVGTTNTQTLTNKTLTTPIVASLYQDADKTLLVTIPAATDTLVGKATTDTLTNKTFDTAGTGNVFKINGTAISAVTGSGSVVLATSPSLTTPTLGVATATSINGITFASGTNTFSATVGTASLDIAAGATADINANITVESASAIDQDVTSDASPTFAAIKLTAGASAGKVLMSDADGDATWEAAPGGELVDDSSPQLGGDLDLNSHSIEIASSPAANTYEGNIITLTAHEEVSLGQLCYINTDGEAALTDADSSSTMPGMLMAAATISADASGPFLLPGSVVHLHTLAPGWTVGRLVYAGSGATSSHTAGAINQGIPTGSGDQVQVVGVALGADVLLFVPSPVVVEVA